MALRNGFTHSYTLAKSGVDFWHALKDVPKENSPHTKNCYYRDGIIQRLGMSKLTSNQVASSKAITALHRFYYGTNSKQLIAAAGTVVKAYNTGTSDWDNIQTGLTDGAQVTFQTWGPKDAIYAANGNEQSYKWNGTTKTQLTALPSGIRQFLPLLDRMLWIDTTDPSFIRYTAAYDDTVVESAQNALKVPGPGRIEGMAYHGLKTDTGFATRCVISKADSMWLLSANDLTPASIDARLDVISPIVGCVAWRTIQFTPIGTIFLSTDRQVYLITFDGSVIPIGSNISSNRPEVNGLEDIPSSGNTLPWAVYHNGLYKLYIPAASGTYCTVSFWLDCTRFHQHPRSGMYGPWYGPMMGQALSHGVVQNGSGDDGALIVGEANATTGGYVYQADNTNADDGTAISMIYQTNYADAGKTDYFKTYRQFDAEFASVDGTLTTSFYDTPGVFSDGSQVTLSSSAVYWDDVYWDDFYWSGAGEPTRYQFVPDEKIIARNLSISFTYSSTTDQFKLYSINAQGQVRSKHAYVGATARE